MLGSTNHLQDRPSPYHIALLSLLAITRDVSVAATQVVKVFEFK